MKLISYLFETNAMRICKENHPFWYTSGKIGPYYINTHFLYGSEESATDLLKFIDEESKNQISLPKKILEATLKNYQMNPTYKSVIDEIKEYIAKNIDVSEIDYISGGERRDWFFSCLVAHLLQKPHLTLFKDLTAVVSDPGFQQTEMASDLKGSKVLHIADLITEASSYERAWIPAIQNMGGKMCWSTVVVDRMQGGSTFLNKNKIASYALIKVDHSLFDSALEMNIINNNQYEMLLGFATDPDFTMKAFLKDNPEFLKNALNSEDVKTVERARLCVDKDLYGLDL